MDKPKRIYISGAMTGIKDYNYPAFNAMAEQLRSAGYEVENPAENEPPECGSWQGWMRIAIAQLMRCDAIVMLDGWEKSKGATVEFDIAVKVGINVFTESDFLKIKLTQTAICGDVLANDALLREGEL